VVGTIPPARMAVGMTLPVAGDQVSDYFRGWGVELPLLRRRNSSRTGPGDSYPVGPMTHSEPHQREVNGNPVLR